MRYETMAERERAWRRHRQTVRTVLLLVAVVVGVPGLLFLAFCVWQFFRYLDVLNHI